MAIPHPRFGPTLLAAGLFFGALDAARGAEPEPVTQKLPRSAAETPAVQPKHLEQMQGTWQVVAIESRGEKVPADKLTKANLRLIIKGNEYTYRAGDRPLGEGTFKLDPTKKPPTIDVTGTAMGKEEKTLGIYELKGDVMRVCFVPDGEQRPKAIATGPDSKANLIEYRRVKP